MSGNMLHKVNPFPGLRPFRTEEHHLFFGREDQTAALLQLLRVNRFLAVVGTSGSGKSSLVRAGMIAELHGGTMTQAGSTWEVMILRPGGSPIQNIARAMVEADLYDAEDPSSLPRLQATLNRSRFGLVEAIKQSDVFEPGTNLLVVIDQFEELFRFRQQGVDSEEAAAAFVNLLLTASQQAECPIYVTITMRSDYLGDCSEIPGLAEAVNQGEYLIPRLQRDQKRDAIEKPIGVGGAKISPMLVQRLLNDVGDDPDQLPVLQHALMRMWDVWSAAGDHSRPIEIADFEATGGLNSALSNHADEIYDTLPENRHREVCEKVFKALTEKGEDNRGIRRPTRLLQLQAIAGSDREAVTTVLDAFRCAGVTFLMPGMEAELSSHTVIDLSHESLMRGWQRLRVWVEDEAQSARVFRRLLDTARLWRDGKAGLFRDPDLQIALSWRDVESPNEAWAEQYGGSYETAINFLETSNADAAAELRAKEAARQHELEQAQMLAEAEREKAETQRRSAKRLRYMVAGLAVIAVFAVGASIAAMNSWHTAEAAKLDALASEQSAREFAEAAKKEAERATLQEAAAIKATSDAEKNLTRARTAIDGFLVNVSESKLLSTPGLQPLRADLLAEASKFYEDFLANNPNNAELQTGLADAFYRVGFVNGDIGNFAEAKNALQKSIDLWQAALENNPSDPLILHGLANSNYRIAVIHYFESQGNDAGFQTSKAAARLWNELIQLQPEHLEYKKSLARAYNLMALHGTTDREANFLAYRKSLEIRLELLPDYPNDAELLHGLGESFNNLGNQLPYGDQQLELLQRSLEFNKIVTQLDPTNVEYAGDLAIGYSVTSRIQTQLNRKTEALKLLLDGAKASLEFIRRNPAVPAMRQYLLSFLGTLQSTAIEPTLAEQYTEVFRSAAQTLQSIPIDSPQDLAVVAGVGQLYQQHLNRMATEIWKRELTASEQAELSALKTGIQELTAKFQATQSNSDPALGATTGQLTDRQLQLDRAIGLLAISTLDAAYKRDAHAQAAFTEAYEIYQSLAETNPEDEQLQKVLADLQVKVADQLWTVGKLKEAKQIYESYIDQLVNQSNESPEDASLARKAWDAQNDYAYKFLEHGLDEEAGRQLSSAVKYYRVPDESHEGDISTIAILKPFELLLTNQIQEFQQERSRVFVENQASMSTEVLSRLVRLAAITPNVVEDPAQFIEPAKTLTYSWHVYSHGLLLYRTGDYAGALDILTPARQDQEYLLALPVADFIIAMCQFQLGQIDESRQLYDQLATQGPGQMPAWTHEAYCLFDVDWYVLRREACQLIYGDDYSTNERMRRGAAFAKLGETEKSAREFAAVVEKLGDYPLAHAMYARTLAELGQIEQAEVMLDKTQQLAAEQMATLPKDDSFWEIYGAACRLLNRPEQAAEIFRHAFTAQTVKILADPQNAAAIKRWTELNSQLSDALTAANQSAAADAARLELEQMKSAFSINSQHVEDAADLLVDKTETQAPVQLESLNQLLSLSADRSTDGDFVQAVLTARLHQLRGELVKNSGSDAATDDFQSARDLYQKVLTAEVNNEQAASGLADVLLEMTAPITWATLQPVEMKSAGGAALSLLEDGSILASGTNPDEEVYEFTFEIPKEGITGLRLESILDQRLPFGFAGRAVQNGSFIVSRFLVSRVNSDGSSGQNPIEISRGISDIVGSNNRSIENALDGNRNTHWTPHPDQKNPHWAIFQFASKIFPESPGQRLIVTIDMGIHEFGPHALGRFRLSTTSGNVSAGADEHQVAVQSLADPWAKLGYVYQIRGDDTAFDELFRQHSSAAAGPAAIAESNANWQAALDWYNKAITPETTDDLLFARRAEVHEKLENWDLAAADWKTADEASTQKNVRYTGAPYLMHRYRIHQRLKLYEEMIADTTTLIGRENNPWWRTDRAVAYDNLHKWEEARIDHDTAISEAARYSNITISDLLKKRAEHHILQEHWKEAAEDFASAAQQANPASAVNSWGFSRERALISLMAGDIQGYQAFAAELEQRLPQNIGGFAAQGYIDTFVAGPGMVNEGNIDRLLAANESSGDFWMPRKRAAILFRAGRIEEAAEAFKDLPNAGHLGYLAVLAYEQTGQLELAARTLSEVNSQIQKHSDWRIWAGIQALKREAENRETRHEELEKLLASEPTDADGYIQRGRVLVQFARVEEALADFSKGIELNPESVALLQLRADTYQGLAQWDQARTDRSRACELDPKLTVIFFTMYKSIERWQDAAAFGALLIEKTPENAVTWLQQSPILFLAGDDPAYFEFCDRIVQQFGNTTDAATAARIMKPLLLTDHTAVEVLETLGKAVSDELENGTTPEGMRHWRWGTLALLKYRTGDPESAVQLAEKSEELSPFEPSHLFNLAVLALAHSQLQQFDEARLALDEVAPLISSANDDPAKKIHHDFLIARILAQEAINEFQKQRLAALSNLLETDPQNGETYLKRGQLLLELDREEEALADFSKGLELDQESVELRQARADFYQRHERWKEATADLQSLWENRQDDVQFASSLAESTFNQSHPVMTWTIIDPEQTKSTGATLTKLEDGSFLAGPTNGNGDDHFTFMFPRIPDLASIRLELIPDESLPSGGVGRHESGNAQVREIRLFQTSRDETWSPVPLTDAAATFGWPTAEVERAIDGNLSDPAWHVWSRQYEYHEAVFHVDTSFANDSGEQMIIEIYHRPDVSLGRFRLSYSAQADQFESARTHHAWSPLSDPWSKLAVAFYLNGDEKNATEVLTAHPQAALAFGDFAVAMKDWKAAIASYSRLIAEETDGTEALERRAQAYLKSEQWDLALDDWKNVVGIQPNRARTAFNAFHNAARLGEAAVFAVQSAQQNPEDSILWLQVAPTLVLTGKAEEYSTFCKWIISQPTDDIQLAERATKSCLLIPNVIDISTLPLERFTPSLDDGMAAESFAPWGWVTRALADYRSGNLESAVNDVARSEEMQPTESTHLLGLVVLAMAYHSQGMTTEAQAALDKAAPLIEQNLQNPVRRIHHDFLIPLVLFQEASAKINGNPETATRPDKSSDRVPGDKNESEN